jgi:septal ring-binding cell division protein DamX
MVELLRLKINYSMEEIKKEVKTIQVSKNAIIIALSIALVLVSAVAIGLAVAGDEHGHRGEHDRNGMMEQRQAYDDNNMNPNDGETNDDQDVPVDQNAKPVTTAPTTKPVAPQTTPKQQ